MRKKILLFFCFIFTVGLVLSIGYTNFDKKTEKLFEGKGTYTNPYLINDLEDLENLRDKVNYGESFYNIYFRQTADIDMSSVHNWIPIGIYESGYYFYGTYDGNNHKIINLNIKDAGQCKNGAFFGQLAGCVYNLEISSGHIEGNYVGSIASHSYGYNAQIINCINRASIDGIRAGGIADNFQNGIIANCINYGNVSGTEFEGAIVSYTAKSIYCCYGKQDLVNKNYDGLVQYCKILDTIDTHILDDNIERITEIFNLKGITKWKNENS